jgi:RNA polymerase sigma factor (sigma-70 family)
LDITTSEGFTLAFQDALPLLLNMAKRIVGPQRAEDVVAETALKAWKHRDAYHGEKGAQPKTWLCRIALNEAISTLRKDRRQFEDVAALVNLVDTGPGPERRAIALDFRTVLSQRIQEPGRISKRGRESVTRWLAGESERIAGSKPTAWRYLQVVKALAATC